MNVTIMAGAYEPAKFAGGPVQSLRRIVRAESRDHRIFVITRDRDIGDDQPFPGLSHGEWVSRGPAQVLYIRDTLRNVLKTLIRQMRTGSSDVLYLNSLFSPRFTLWPLLLQRLHIIRFHAILIAPRGELGPAALAIKSWKKRPTSFFLRHLLLPRATIFHASSLHEEEDIHRFLGWHAVNCVVQSNPAPSPRAPEKPLPGAALQIAQVGRIVKIKNLATTLEALAPVTFPVHLHIVGNVEDAKYWERCISLMARLPPNVQVSAPGHLDTDEVLGLLAHTDLMVLPTGGENFGQAIAEALSVGCPVVIPPTTPWTSMVERGAGYLIDQQDPSASIAGALAHYRGLTDAGRALRRKGTADLYSSWCEEQVRTSTSVFTSAAKLTRRRPL